MTWPTAKRFYDAVGVAAVEGGFAVTLDEKHLRTPAGEPLTLPTEGLAHALAGEWGAQEGEVRPHTMPLSRIAATAIDRVPRERAETVDRVLKFAATDLLCYRAISPRELSERQRAAWQPLLDWAAETHGARLEVTEGVVPIEQPVAAIEALRRAVEPLDDLGLAALTGATAATGSLIIGLALAAGRISGEEAVGASQLDEEYQNQRWGEDEEAVARRRDLRDEIMAAAGLLDLL